MKYQNISVLKMCEVISRGALYVLLFLMPLFFLPFTSDKLDFNKQALLLVLAFLSLFAWIVRTLIVGKLTLHIHKINIVAGVLFLAYLASTIFSVARYSSFWGWPQSTPESLLTLIGLLTVYFLVSNLFTQRDVLISFMVLACSVTVVQLYGILQMFGVHIVPLAFTQSNSFTTVGSVGGFGFFAAATLPMSIILLSTAKKWWKVLFAVSSLMSFIILLLINYQTLWILALVGAGAVMIVWLIKRSIFDGRWTFVPIFFIIVSLFFVIFSPQIRWSPVTSVEVSISPMSNVAIDAKAIVTSPIFGSGPGTFAYNFAKYRDVSFNKSSLWNAVFDAGSSVVLTSVTTVGILGVLALLVFMFWAVFLGVQYLVRQKGEDDTAKNSLVMITVTTLVVITVGYFLRNTNLTIHFLYFFSLATLVSLVARRTNTYLLKPSSLLTLLVTFAVTLISIFGVGFLMLEGQRYVAQVYFTRGTTAIAAGNKEAGIQEVKKAASHNSELDFYFTQIALSTTSSVQDKVSQLGNSPSDEQKNTLKTLVTDAVNAANVATKLGPNNIETWSAKGYVCQNLAVLVSDWVTCAIGAYDKAIALNPSNPYFVVQQGNVYLVQAATASKDQASEKGGMLAQAKEKYEKALALKLDYALAHYQLGLVAYAQQDEQEGVRQFTQAAQNASGDASLAFQIGYVYYQYKTWNLAQAEFSRALVLVPTYANALYYSGLTYDWQGKKEAAISQFAKLLDIVPENVTVKKIIENLRAGKAALDGLVAQPPVPIPATDGSTSTTTLPAVKK